jgi:hypothetical protein
MAAFLSTNTATEIKRKTKAKKNILAGLNLFFHIRMARGIIIKTRINEIPLTTSTEI